MIKKRHILLCFLVFCLTATLLVSVTSSIQPYDPWKDIDENGEINILDILGLAVMFGEKGTPINKTELLLELLERVPKAGNISVSAAAFVPNSDYINYSNWGYGLQNDNSEAYASFYADVQLPHGATVTNVTFFWYDNGDDFIYCRLRRCNQTGAQIMGLADSPIAGAPGEGFSYDDTIDYATVDNNKYAYHLWVDLPCTFNYVFRLAFVEYEYQ